MEKELLKLFDEFEKELNRHNKEVKDMFDDDEEPTLENFIKWLRFKVIF